VRSSRHNCCQSGTCCGGDCPRTSPLGARRRNRRRLWTADRWHHRRLVEEGGQGGGQAHVGERPLQLAQLVQGLAQAAHSLGRLQLWQGGQGRQVEVPLLHESLNVLARFVVVDEDTAEHEDDGEQAGQEDNDHPLHASLPPRLLLHLVVPVDGQVDLVLLLPGVDVRVLCAIRSAVLLGDHDVRAGTELLLMPATNLASAVLAGAPIIGCYVPPLENALNTGEIFGQLVLGFKDAVARSWEISRSNPVALF